MNVNKKDLVNAIAQKTGYYKYEIEDIVNAFITELSSAVAQGDRVSLRGFGTFEAKSYKSHAAVHPVSKERFIVPSYKNAVFSPGDELTRMVRES